ncbi:uncharacterized protein N7469_006270 [Penicillium citrinum]|uniref:Uncharacterized protein n=2 Tax=Penicillium TaxID=5073 RepID=A0A9W9TMF1_PENCI|nr:uncharacterized protein N7469_006270 [Penicillium citrinum]KAJ5231682.1 hypothetical protein N7469_006270 [Penicillium citrinum]KAJ5579211.1 hypothetical protein N7450_008078 [Penicillium hetheringtonii]KAK5787815.1 hypothetical protein VI817_010312 [Penicillium citrinum]
MTPCIGLNKVNTADLQLSPTLVRMEVLRFPVAPQPLIRDPTRALPRFEQRVASPGQNIEL